jgi:hypothetical protein
MSTATKKTTAQSPGSSRWLVVAVLLLGAFFGAYGFAQARSARVATQPAAFGSAPGAFGGQGSPAQGLAAQTGQGATSPNGGAAGGSGCACCGSSAPTANGVTGSPVEGSAADNGGVQSISVDLSKGYYEPNVIKLKAGVPAEITFGQSSGCTGQVISQALGFSEDLTGGPRTVKIPDPKPGTYAFSCGMQMVFGKIVVE